MKPSKILRFSMSKINQSNRRRSRPRGRDFCFYTHLSEGESHERNCLEDDPVSFRWSPDERLRGMSQGSGTVSNSYRDSREHRARREEPTGGTSHQKRVRSLRPGGV